MGFKASGNGRALGFLPSVAPVDNANYGSPDGDEDYQPDSDNAKPLPEDNNPPDRGLECF